MAMTQSALIFIGALATLSTLGLFINLGDRWTNILVEFTASILWGLFGLSSWDVIVIDSFAVHHSEPILPLVYLGFGFAFILALYALYDLVVGAGQQAKETEFGDMV